MKVKRRRAQAADPRQPDLFAAAAPSWVAAHWPNAATGSLNVSSASALALWAATFDEVSDGARVLLGFICREVERHGACCASISFMATETDSTAPTVRKRLDELLAARVIQMRPISGRGKSLRCYETRLLVHGDELEMGGWMRQRLSAAELHHWWSRASTAVGIDP